MAKVGHVVRGGAPGARAEAEGGEPDDSTILRQVLHEVRRLVHRPESEAFSLLRLFAYLVQVAALFVGLVLVIVVEDKSVFIQMGILLQLLALTLFYIEKKQ
jgi:hypothetical protein